MPIVTTWKMIKSDDKINVSGKRSEECKRITVSKFIKP